MAPQNNPPFTPFGSDQPDTSSFNQMMSSLLENGPTSIPLPSQNTAVSTSQSVVAASSAPSSTSSENPSTFATSTVFSSSGSSQTPSITSTSTSTSASTSLSVGSGTSTPSAASSTSTSTATNAASNSDGSVTKSECHSVSCSSGLQAAVAVPVVVGTLAILALIFFLVRRRKKQPTSSKASRSEKPKKKWTRHLKIFSFDAEILGGGRFSSSNSMRSGGSSQHINDTHQREISSLHSTDDAAPPYPYRDVISHSHQPNMTQVGTGIAAGALASNGIPRSTSRASAPPPYSGQMENAPQHTSRALASDDHDPFSDPSPNANPAILINEPSPFRDPSEDGSSTHSRPGISRASSMRTGLDADEVSMMGGSDTGSVREAQIGRHVSVASGGRTITNIRNSGSPTNSETNMPR